MLDYASAKEDRLVLTATGNGVSRTGCPALRCEAIPDNCRPETGVDRIQAKLEGGKRFVRLRASRESASLSPHGHRASSISLISAKSKNGNRKGGTYFVRSQLTDLPRRSRQKYANDTESTREKFIFVVWIGSGVKVMRKAKLSVHSADVKKVLSQFSIEVPANSIEDLNEVSCPFC